MTLAVTTDEPRGIAVDATRVYWVTESFNGQQRGQVMSVPIAGGVATTLADIPGEPLNIVVRNGALYWTNAAGSVMKMSTTGGAMVTLADHQGTTFDIASDANRIYWSSLGQAAIRSLPLVSAGMFKTLLDAHGTPQSIVVRNDVVYWADEAGIVGKVPAGGGPPVTLFSSPDVDPAGIAVDDFDVYWTDNSNGTVSKVGIAGGTPTVLATGQLQPWRMAIDERNVYWGNENLNSTSGSVMKLAK